MNRISFRISDILMVLEKYNVVKIYRSDLENGTYVEITDVDTRIPIIPETTIYYYEDAFGDTSNWYRCAYYNSLTLVESAKSTAIRGGTSPGKVGYTFMNYSPPVGEWGEALTADDMRFTYMFGIDLKGSSVTLDDVTDDQLRWCVQQSLRAWEKELSIDIRKRVYKNNPASTLIRGKLWREGVDYTDRDDRYDFVKSMWQNYGFLQLRHYPIISVEVADLYDVIGNKVMDILPWIRIWEKSGQLAFYPKGSFSLGRGYGGSGVFSAWANMFGTNYPQAFKIDYTTGLDNSDYIDDDLREVIGMYSSIMALNWIGDGLMAGFSSASVSLDGLSESFSSTQSATNAYFGARINQYIKQINDYRLHNKAKHQNIPIGFIGD